LAAFFSFVLVTDRCHVVVQQPDPNWGRWGWEIYLNGQPLSGPRVKRIEVWCRFFDHDKIVIFRANCKIGLAQ
jgi:hypothetical protein